MSPPGQQQGGQCPFCQLISNPDQLIKVGESENFYAWLEVNPRARGHTMVVPKEHKENVLEFSAEEWTEAFNLTREVVEKAKKGLGADGASVTVNIEEAGGQMLPHAYIQVFPRFEGEENAGTPTGAIFPQREDLQQQLEDIQGEMNSVSVDFGEEETHEPHEDSQKFKSAGKIESMLESPGSAEKETDNPPESGEEERKEENTGSSSKNGSDESSATTGSLSKEELFEKLLKEYGSAKELVNSDEFRSVVRKADFTLRRSSISHQKESIDWI